MQKKILSIEIIGDDSLLSLEQFSHAIYIDDDFVVEMVEQQLIYPQGNTPEEWQFDSECLRRAKIALRLHHHLDVNLSGVALALELLDKIDQLEKQLALLKK